MLRTDYLEALNQRTATLSATEAYNDKKDLITSGARKTLRHIGIKHHGWTDSRGRHVGMFGVGSQLRHIQQTKELERIEPVVVLGKRQVWRNIRGYNGKAVTLVNIPSQTIYYIRPVLNGEEDAVCSRWTVNDIAITSGDIIPKTNESIAPKESSHERLDSFAQHLGAIAEAYGIELLPIAEGSFF